MVTSGFQCLLALNQCVDIEVISSLILFINGSGMINSESANDSLQHVTQPSCYHHHLASSVFLTVVV